jgi:putative OmpL-like beta-barrel porin-2
MKAPLCFVILGAVLGAVPVLAQSTTPTPPAFHLGGFVDGYYAWNTNSPDGHESFVPGTGTSAKRSNEFALNLATVELSRDAAPVGFKISLVAGNGADVVHAGEPQGSATGPETFRHLYQASIIYKASDRLTLEGGVYPSHIGFEGFFSKDNWSYTRSWLGEFSPYYQTGVKASYAFNGHWSGQLHVLNGWQIIGENNDGKSVGTQIAYSSDRLSASFNTFVGPELANDDSSLRTLGDLVVVYKATPKLSLGGSIDRGRQDYPDDVAADWTGVAAYARYAISGRSAVSIRAEQFDDPDNGISGAAQKLREATVTYEVRPVDNLILKLEARHDLSTAAVFRKDADALSRKQTLVVFGAVVTF